MAPIAERLLKGWRLSRAEFHRYVSSDPACNVTGTNAPEPARALILSSDVSIRDVFRAVVTLSRKPPQSFLKCGKDRDTVLSIASRLTPYSQADIGRMFGVSNGTVTNAIRRGRGNSEFPALLRAVRRSLQDKRFIQLSPPLEQLARMLNDPLKKRTVGQPKG